ncbi:MAG: rhodanese-related sulfurtransferase [Phototrophicaceae bacterium]
MAQITIAAFYKFIPLPDYAALQTPLQALCDAHQIRGSILLADEGINATVAGQADAIETLLQYLRQDARFSDLAVKTSYARFRPFRKMKVRLKKEIVTIKAPEANPLRGVGHYVPPQDWNALIARPDVILIDTRNDYEFAIGSFKGAVNPETESFSAFTDYVESQLSAHKRTPIAMFCTGGIRCEKATAYLVAQGFEAVYHLQGGILSYLEQIPSEASLWEGECFVFDERVALGHGLTPLVDQADPLLEDES